MKILFILLLSFQIGFCASILDNAMAEFFAVAKNDILIFAGLSFGLLVILMIFRLIKRMLFGYSRYTVTYYH